MNQSEPASKEPFINAPLQTGLYPQIPHEQGQGQDQGKPQQQVIYISATPQPIQNGSIGWSTTCENFPKRQSIGIGIGQIVMGVAVLVVLGVGINVTLFGMFIGVGFIAAGSFGIVAGKKPSRSWITVFVIFCFLAAAGGLILMIVVVLIMSSGFWIWELVPLGIGAVGTGLAIWGSVLGLRVLTCKSTSNTNQQCQPVQLVPVNQNVIFTGPTPGPTGYNSYPGSVDPELHTKAATAPPPGYSTITQPADSSAGKFH